jgi:hypothetical protein
MHVETFPFPHTVAICYTVCIRNIPENATMLVTENNLTRLQVWFPIDSHAQWVVNGSRLPRLPPENKGANLKKTRRKPKEDLIAECFNHPHFRKSDLSPLLMERKQSLQSATL